MLTGVCCCRSRACYSLANNRLVSETDWRKASDAKGDSKKVGAKVCATQRRQAAAAEKVASLREQLVTEEARSQELREEVVELQREEAAVKELIEELQEKLRSGERTAAEAGDVVTVTAAQSEAAASPCECRLPRC